MRAHEFADQGAAGCILYAEDTGRYGFQQRSNEINDPGLWAAWGGGREPGESLEQCARRELAEESGYTGPIKLQRLAENSRYVTFIGTVPHEFEPRPDPEWQDYCWVEAGDWPSPMHPDVASAVKNIPAKKSVTENREEFEGITIEMKKRGHVLDVSALDDWGNNILGYVIFNIGDGNELDPQELEVDTRYQGQGIAKAMYDYVKSKGYTINRSWDQTDAGAGFWNKHRGEHVRVWETVDVDAIHAQALREHLLRNPGLYENSQDFESIRNFLDTHHTPTPTVGNRYVYASVQATPVTNYISIAHFSLGHKLTKLDQKYAYFYINGKIKRFPESGTLSGDALSQIYFFNSPKGFEHFDTLLKLKFPNHKQTSKILDQQDMAENFADGRVKGKSRPGRVKRAGASCAGSVTDLRAKAKKYGGERGKMYHWCANMKGGKK